MYFGKGFELLAQGSTELLENKQINSEKHMSAVYKSEHGQYMATEGRGWALRARPRPVPLGRGPALRFGPGVCGHVLAMFGPEVPK